MLQQSFTQDNQTQAPSTLSPTTSPQPGLSSDMQGAADQDLLQQEGQTIQVPSSGGTTTQQQMAQPAEGSPVVATQPVFQPIEIIVIFVAVGVLLVATATYIVKKAKTAHLPESSRETGPGQTPLEQEESVESAVGESPAKQKRQKKQTRRQRRQFATRDAK